MTRGEIRQKVIDALVAVAPELRASSAQLDDHQLLRDQVDLDSIDFLRFVQELHVQLAIDVPESDYVRLGSVSTAVEYLAARAGVSGA